jgi:hypothetical protein
MGAGKGQSQATTTSQPNPVALSNYYNLMSRANQVGSTPYQAYQGNLLAPFSQSQQSAFNTIDQAQGIANADINQAQNYAAQGAAPITGQQIASYENPYQNQVIGATLGQIQYLDANQQAALASPYVGSGGLFNDRFGVAQANLTYNQNLANNQTLSQLNSQNYAQALAAAQAQQAASAGASYQFGNLGAEQQATTLQGAQAQLGSGAIQQQQAQQGLNIPYQQFQQAQAFPYQQLSWLSGIDTGVGSQMGGTSSTAYQPPAPNPWNVGLGLGLAGLGAFYGGPQGAMAGWGIGSQVKRGGRVGYDDGGPVMPYGGARSWIPSIGITRGGGAPRPPTPIMPRQGSGAPKNLGSFWGPSRPAGAPMELTPQYGSGVGDMAPMPTGPANAGLGGLYRRGGAVGFADGGSPDDLGLGGMDPAFIDQAIRSGTVGRAPNTAAAALPGIYNYFTADRPAPDFTPNAAGKLARGPNYDPYAEPALREGVGAAAGLGAGALLGPEAGYAARAAIEEGLPVGMSLGEGLAAHEATRGAYGELANAASNVPAMTAAGVAGAPSPAAASEMSARARAAVERAIGPRPELPDTNTALGPRPVATSDEQAAIDKLDSQIGDISAKREAALAALTKKQQAAMERAGPGPKARAAAGAPFAGQMDPLRKSYNDQIGLLNEQINTITGQVAKRQGDYDERASTLNGAIQKRQSDWDDQATEFLKQNAPFAVRHPAIAAAARAAPIASLGLGNMLGRWVGPAKGAKANKVYASTVGGGAMEGALGAYAPTYMDLEMPEGSEAREQASRSNQDVTGFWGGTVLPEAAFSAGLGALGAKYGMAGEAKKARDLAAAAKVARNAPVAAPAAVAPAAKAGRQYPDLNDPAALSAFHATLRKDSLGRWYEPGKGLVKQEYQPPPGRPAGNIIPMTAAESRGGAVMNALRVARKIGGRTGYDIGGPVADDFTLLGHPTVATPTVYNSDAGGFAPMASNPAVAAPWGDLSAAPMGTGTGSRPLWAASLGADRLTPSGLRSWPQGETAPALEDKGNVGPVGPVGGGPAPSRTSGIDWGRYTANTFDIESGGNPNAVTGSNRGLGQFGPQEEREYGINDSNRRDPEVQARALRMEAEGNIPRLSAVLGRPPTEGELYLAHQQGPGGAPALLANPDAPAWQAVRRFYPDDQTAKLAIAGNIPRTSPLASLPVEAIKAGDFVSLWTSRYGRGPAGGGPPSPSGGGMMAFAPTTSASLTSSDLARGPGSGGQPAPSSAAPGNGGIWTPRFRNALITAGLSLAANRSPYLGPAIGEAGLAGVGAYQEQGRYEAGQQQQQQRFNLEQSRVDAQVKRLDQMAEQSRQATEFHSRQLEETARRQEEAERHNREQEAATRQRAGVPEGYRLKDDGSVEPIRGGPKDPDVIRRQKEAEAAGKAAGVGESGLDDVTLRRTAAQYNIMGPTALANLGRGQQSGAALLAVRREAARQDEEAGINPDQRAQMQAQYQGQKAAQRTLGTSEARMGMAGFEAMGAIELGRHAIEAVPRTGFLPLNRLIQGYQNQTLSPEQAELLTRTKGIINTYSAVMARGANVVTDASRQRAEELLNTATDSAVYNRVLDTMQSEIKMAIDAPDKMRDFYMKKYGAQAAAAPTETPTAPPAAPAAAPTTTPGAVRPSYAPRIVIQNGQRFQVNPDGSATHLGAQ